MLNITPHAVKVTTVLPRDNHFSIMLSFLYPSFAIRSCIKAYSVLVNASTFLLFAFASFSPALFKVVIMSTRACRLLSGIVQVSSLQSASTSPVTRLCSTLRLAFLASNSEKGVSFIVAQLLKTKALTSMIRLGSVFFKWINGVCYFLAFLSFLVVLGYFLDG